MTLVRLKTALLQTPLSPDGSHCNDANTLVILGTRKQRADINFVILSVSSPNMVCYMSKVNGDDGDVDRVDERDDAGAGVV